MTSPPNNLEWVTNEVGYLLQQYDEARGQKDIDQVVAQAVSTITQKLVEARIKPFDFVEPCEPKCTPERHAYHQGQWDMALRIEQLLSSREE